MQAVETQALPDWHEFWGDLERAEETWAVKLDDAARAAFEQAVLAMIRASVPRGERAALYATWPPGNFGGYGGETPWNSTEMEWGILCTLPTPDAPTGGVVDEMMLRFDWAAERGEAGSPAVVDRKAVEAALAAFVDRLRYSMLVTSWNFTRNCREFVRTLPALVHRHLDAELWELTLKVLLEP